MNKRQKKKKLKYKIVSKPVDNSVKSVESEAKLSNFPYARNSGKRGSGISNLIFSDGTIVNISSGVFVVLRSPDASM